MGRSMIVLPLALLAGSAAYAARPSIGTVVVGQDPVTRMVTVDYTLANGPAVVTMDVRTNGVSVGGRNLRRMAGDVNRKVATAAGQITWMPEDGLLADGRVEIAATNVVVTAWALDAPPDYMVADLCFTSTVKFYPSAEALPEDVTNDMFKTDFLVMRKIPANGVIWRMGSPTTVAQRQDNETPHYVKFTNDYYIGVFEVTQRQYERVFGSPTSSGANCHWTFTNVTDWACRPIEGIKWDYLRGSQNGWPDKMHDNSPSFGPGKFRSFTGIAFDLPTEAQWEYACRAGTGTVWYDGKNSYVKANFEKLAWYDENAAEGYGEAQTHPVGMKKPNAWGLYDMYGNVQEWCLDWYETPYSVDDAEANLVVDPTGPAADYNADGTINYRRIARGGSFKQAYWRSYSAYRNAANKNTEDTYGFRLCCPAKVP